MTEEQLFAEYERVLAEFKEKKSELGALESAIKGLVNSKKKVIQHGRVRVRYTPGTIRTTWNTGKLIQLARKAPEIMEAANRKRSKPSRRIFIVEE